MKLTPVLPARTLELEALRDFSVRVGRNPMLVQASSGNTSIKLGGDIWIKASGRWLARAAEQESLVAIDVANVRRSVRRGEEFMGEGIGEAGGLYRASVETAMHAVLPQRVVAHVHSVQTLAWAVRQDGPERLVHLLAGMPWEWVPYVPSGLSLAQAILGACQRSPEAAIFVLANHGLVVCGETCEDVEQLLSRVESRLASRERAAPPWDPGLAEIARMDQAVLPDDPDLHSLATDRVGRAILAGGILYPCQAMFLGTRWPDAGYWEEDAPLKIVPGRGILLRKSITRTQRAVLAGLKQVVQRLEKDVPVRYLTGAEIQSLFEADAHGYRQSAEANA